MNWNDDWRSFIIGILGALITEAILKTLKYSYPALKQYVIAASAACSREASKIKQCVIQAIAACSREASKTFSAFINISWLGAIGRKCASFAGALVEGVISIVAVIFWPAVILGGINLIARNQVNTPRAFTAPTYQAESCNCPSSSNGYTLAPTYSSVYAGTPAYRGIPASYSVNEEVNSAPAPRRPKTGKKSQIIYSGLEVTNASVYIRRTPNCDRLPWGIKRSRPR